MTKATSKIMNDKIYTIIGFLVFVLIVILTMSVFKGKHDQRVESLDFLKNLFGLGKDPPPKSTPYSTTGSSARSTVGTDTTGSTIGTGTGGSSASNSGRSTVQERRDDYLQNPISVDACATETGFNWAGQREGGGGDLQATDGMRAIMGEPPYTLAKCQDACILENTCGGFTYETPIWKGTVGSCLFKGADMTIESIPESYWTEMTGDDGNNRAGKIATFTKCCDDDCVFTHQDEPIAHW
jgi:hypothetical protein